MLVEFLKDYECRKVGDIADLWHHSASYLMKEGIVKPAEVVEEKKKGRPSKK